MNQEIKHIGKIIPPEGTIKLDKINRKIISILMFNNRINYSQLSKFLKLSKSNIIRRVNLLKKNELILENTTYFDLTKLNLKTGILLIQTQCTEMQKEKYLKKITSNGWVYSALEITGKYDLLIGFYYKDNHHHEELIEELINFNLIRDFSFYPIETIFSHLDYAGEFKEFEKNKVELNKIIKMSEYTALFQDQSKKITVDKTDIKLLNILSEDCRKSFIDLADKLKISRETVNYRIKKLVSGGIITKFQPTINLFKLGFDGYLLLIKLKKPTQKQKIIDYLRNTKKCNTILKSNGEYNIITFIHFKTNSNFRKFENELISKFKDLIYEYSFEITKKQEKLDWFPKQVADYLLKTI